MLRINLLIFLFSMCSLLLSFNKTPGMHWVKVLFVFLFGGFIGIAIMAALMVARNEDDKMDECSAALKNSEKEEN